MRYGRTLVGGVCASGLLVGAYLILPVVEAEPKAKTRAKAAPAASTEALRAPLERLGVILDGFHVRDGRPEDQMEAIHYCGEVNPDLIQCVLFDKAGPDARMIGVEYVVSAKVIDSLPTAERALWHSHAYEVSSGMLHAPGATPSEEHALMQKVAGTYGKTWHTWQVDEGDRVPVGRPSLMMAFTKDGQARAGLTDERDRTFGVSTRALARRRADIAAPRPLAGVDRGEQGQSCEPQIQRVRGR